MWYMGINFIIFHGKYIQYNKNKSKLSSNFHSLKKNPKSKLFNIYYFVIKYHNGIKPMILTKNRYEYTSNVTQCFKMLKNVFR